jgi:hypothetical protein
MKSPIRFIINPAVFIAGLIRGTGMCCRRPKAGASPRNASKFAHLRQRFAGDGEIDQDDLFRRRVNSGGNCVRVVGVSLVSLLLLAVASFAYADNKLSANDLTEGGNLESDTGANFLAEWWYLNGHLQLEAEDGEKRAVGWFAVMGHQESPLINDGMGNQLSHMLKFSALYDEDGTNHFVYNETFIPRSFLEYAIGIHKPYLAYHFPMTSSTFFGAASTGYTVNDQLNGINFTMFFKPGVEKTVDQSEAPLNFTTYEYGNGKIGGTITLDGKQFFVKKGNAYFDHMIPTSPDTPWPTKMNGWSWAEITTHKYQAVIYAIRSLEDGFDAYSYKHLTIINQDTGEVEAEFSDDDVEIIESDWVEEPAFGVYRPQSVTYRAGNYEVSVHADQKVNFDRTSQEHIGFVDFMAYQPQGAAIKHGNKTHHGNAFYEYLVSDAGAANQP